MTPNRKRTCFHLKNLLIYWQIGRREETNARITMETTTLGLNMKPLLEQPDIHAEKSFPDAYLMTACLIERSLIQGGAIPGEDYTIIDLYRLAGPLILSRYEKGAFTDVL
jgi:hypothetical protein